MSATASVSAGINSNSLKDVVIGDPTGGYLMKAAPEQTVGGTYIDPSSTAA
jgi:hypothetical protein